MIPCTLDWISRMNKEYGIRPAKVLDVGSYDYNGNPRSLFPDSEYIGIDVKEGPNVDIVMDARKVIYEYGTRVFDAVLCLYVFEHIPRIYPVSHSTYFVLKTGGYFYLSVPDFGYPYHQAPDYWRFSEDTVRDVLMGIEGGYDILSLEHGKSQFGKHPVINCLGVKG